MKEKINFWTERDLYSELTEQGLLEQYENLRDYERKLFTNFCTGQSLTLLTYDSIFKFLFQSDGSYQRLEHFLTATLGFEVQVEELLPLEGTRVVRNGGVLFLDVIAKTKDNRIINVEMQKYPYRFCGERESCYLADMIMRQYNQRVSEAKKADRKFHYKDMRPVYMIILLENSYHDFKKMDDYWRHDGKICFETGIELNYLPYITYITLDNFRNIEQNIDTEQKKWMYLFSANTSERISRTAAMSEEFFEIIQDVARFCMDVGEVFSMFSEALRIMDRNEEELMYAEAMEKLSDTEEKLSEAEEKVSLIQKICKLAMQGQAIEEIAEQCQMSKEEVEYILNN